MPYYRAFRAIAMKGIFLAVAALFVAQVSSQVSCEAAPIWNCGGGKKPEAPSPYAGAEIVRLDKGRAPFILAKELDPAFAGMTAEFDANVRV